MALTTNPVHIIGAFAIVMLGALYPVSVMPGWLRVLSKINPLS